jgi:hypothetical protein
VPVAGAPVLGDQRRGSVSENASTARGLMQATLNRGRGHDSAGKPSGTQRFDACQRGCLEEFRLRPECPWMGSVDSWPMARPISSNWRYPPAVDAE